MRILYIAPRPPFPPEGRETVRPYHQIRSMALRHEVDLICFSGGGVDEWDARARLSNLCPRVQIVPIDTPPQEPSRVRNLFNRRPLALQRFFRKGLFRRLKDLAETNRYDVVFVYSAAMAPYLGAFPATPKVLDLVDVGSLRWMEYAHLSRFPSKAVYRAEAHRLMFTERKGAERAQRILFASEEEAEVFRGLCPGNGRISAVKTPVNPRAALKGPWAAEPTVLFTGNLDHFPNADAAVHLLVELFPRIKSLVRTAKLAIVGRNAPGEVRMLADRAGVTLVEGRHDLRQIFRNAWLQVAPHRVSRGVRNEILEAMAVGLPVVATREAASGLDFIAGRDYLVESEPARFAAAVARLLHDPGELDALGERGRKSIHNNYSHWGASLALEEVLNQASVETLVAP